MRPTTLRLGRLRLSIDDHGLRPRLTIPAGEGHTMLDRPYSGDVVVRHNFEYGEAEILRDWLTDYLESGGR